MLIGYTGLRCEEVSARQIGGWMEKEGWEVKYAATDEFYVYIDIWCACWLKALGFEVHAPDMSMITMCGGGVHCMAQPLRRDRV